MNCFCEAEGQVSSFPIFGHRIVSLAKITFRRMSLIASLQQSMQELWL